MTIASLFKRAQARPGSVGENLKDIECLWENLRPPPSGGWNNNLPSHQPLPTASSLILSRSSAQLENQKQFPDQVSLSLEPGFTGICPSVSPGKSPSSKGRFAKAYRPLLPSCPLLFAPSHQQPSILQSPSLKGGIFSIPSRSQPFH